MHKESLSCLALHRHRKITSLDCGKVLTNYFRPLVTAGGIISLSLSLPGGLRDTTVSMTGPLQERKPVLWFVIQIEIVKDLDSATLNFCCSHFPGWWRDETEHSYFIGQCMTCLCLCAFGPSSASACYELCYSLPCSLCATGGRQTGSSWCAL